jgi:hypothetical protein
MEVSYSLSDIQSPEVLDIIKTIKAIQQRMKDDDNKKLDSLRLYDKLSYEFNDFFERYTKIFVQVIKCENMRTIASVLYYKDLQLRGLITEAQISEKLAATYLTPEMKDLADKKINEMKNGEFNSTG